METNMFGFKSRNGRRRGSAVLDAALVFPVLLSVTFGTIEYGYYFFVKHTLQGAAREGARAGIVPTGSSGTGDSSAVTTAVVQYLRGAGLNTGTSTLDSKFTLKIEYPLGTTINAGSLSTGSALYVTIQSSWGTIGQGFRPMSLIGSSKVVSGVAVMRKEG
jgi:Flp pilus assembly protein TadG